MTDPVLREIRLTITAPAEDAVAEMLGQMFGVATSTHADWETGLTHVTAFLPAKASWTSGRRREVFAALDRIRGCGLDVGRAELRVRRIRKSSWAEAWKRHFQPIEIGDALLIRPSWNRRKSRPGQALIVLDPGLSFGTGQHATTSFCLHQLAVSRNREVHQSFLDLGTGSGLLAIAAAKLGYRPVVALDYDPESIRVARANAVANGVGGIVRPVRKNVSSLRVRGARTHDVVCANLIYDLLVAEARRIAACVNLTGRLVLAGILTSQFTRVINAYKLLGFRLLESRVGKEWKSGVFVRAGRR